MPHLLVGKHHPCSRRVAFQQAKWQSRPCEIGLCHGLANMSKRPPTRTKAFTENLLDTLPDNSELGLSLQKLTIPKQPLRRSDLRTGCVPNLRKCSFREACIFAVSVLASRGLHTFRRPSPSPTLPRLQCPTSPISERANVNPHLERSARKLPSSFAPAAQLAVWGSCETRQVSKRFVAFCLP